MQRGTEHMHYLCLLYICLAYEHFLISYFLLLQTEGIVWIICAPHSSLKIHLPNDFAPEGNCACISSGNEFHSINK